MYMSSFSHVAIHALIWLWKVCKMLRRVPVSGTGQISILSQRNHVGMSHVAARCAHVVLLASGDQDNDNDNDTQRSPSNSR